MFPVPLHIITYYGMFNVISCCLISEWTTFLSKFVSSVNLQNSNKLTSNIYYVIKTTNSCSVCLWRTHSFFFHFFYNKQLHFMKGICWYHIWSYKNTNLLNVCVVLFILHIWCSISSLNLSTYKKWRNSILLSSRNLLLCI